MRGAASGDLGRLLADPLISVVHRIGAHAERRVERKLIADLKKVSGKTNTLFRLAEAAVDHPDGVISEVLYPIVGEQKLRYLVREYKATGPAYREHVRTRLRASYSGHYRKVLPRLLEALPLRSSNTTHRPVLDAVVLIARYADRAGALFDVDEVVPMGVVPAGWRDLVIVIDGKGRERVNRIVLEIYTLQAVRDRLRCKEIWIDGAARWRNPDDDLPADFDDRRDDYYRQLGQNCSTPPSSSPGSGNGWPPVSTGCRASSSPRVGASVDQREAGWVDQLVAARRATRAAQHRTVAPSGERTLAGDLAARHAEGDRSAPRAHRHLRNHRNAHGARPHHPATPAAAVPLRIRDERRPAPDRRRDDHGESERDLRHVRRRYLTTGNVRRAITEVVNATLAARHEHLWGQATTTASDSTKFGAWDHNLLTEWHARYRGPGVMIYWHVERKALCVYSQLKSCSSSEVAAMIEGVVRHETTMEIEANMVDSHGQSEIGFVFAELLGFRLLPRLKRRCRSASTSPRPGTRRPMVTSSPRSPRVIDWDLIASDYDQMIRYTTGIRNGTADAESILRRFTRSNVQHPTYRALAELGKALRTIFLCDYLTSEQLRREIHEGLNVAENWNSANGFIFFGKAGEFTTNRRDDQELAVLCLHLLQATRLHQHPHDPRRPRQADHHDQARPDRPPRPPPADLEPRHALRHLHPRPRTPPRPQHLTVTLPPTAASVT